MSINLEQIDELRKRANVGYEDAKDALEKFDGNLVDALIYLEKNKRTKGAGFCEGKNDFFDKVKHMWKKGNKIRLIVKRSDRTLLNLPLAMSLIVGLLAFHVTIVALVLALIFGCRFKLENGSEEMKVNETLNKVQDNIESIKQKLSDDL